jgi:hypothetical protein
MAALRQFSEIRIERFEHVEKQSYRNRCHVLAAHGPETLIVPLTGKHGKMIITDVQIDYSQKWMLNHIRTLQSAYRKAPYYDYYADDLWQLMEKRFTTVYEMNFSILQLLMRWFRCAASLTETERYEKVCDHDTVDLRNRIHPKKHLPDLIFPEYTQVFGQTFIPGLSSIDLIFCTGPEAVHYLPSLPALLNNS